MINTTVERLGAVLAQLDALAAARGMPEDLEDLNAEFEDALMLLSDVNPREDGWKEEIADALEELRSLAGDYRKLAGRIPGLEALADALVLAAKIK